MEYLEKILKKTGWSSLITSVIFAILGIILIMRPGGTVKFISYVLGVMFVLIGLYRIISYVRNKGQYNFYNLDCGLFIVQLLE